MHVNYISDSYTYTADAIWGASWAIPNFFSVYGVCHYCESTNNNNLSIVDVLICDKCFKSAIDIILRGNLNRKIIQIVNQWKK